MVSLVNRKRKKHISIYNRNVQFGDGVFETCLLQNSRLVFWDYHFSRLIQGAKLLDISPPSSQVWLADIQALINHSRLKHGVIKLILSRGNSKQGYRFDNIKPIRIVSILPLSHIKKNNRLGVCQYHYAHQNQLVGIKHCNRLDNILANHQLKSTWLDGVMLDKDGWVISTTKANIYMVVNQEVLTPKLENCGIKGTLRQVVFELCPQLNIPIKESNISLAMLENADEVFISNSILGIYPITHILKQSYTIGAITTQIKQAVEQSAMESKTIIKPAWWILYCQWFKTLSIIGMGLVIALILLG